MSTFGNAMRLARASAKGLYFPAPSIASFPGAAENATNVFPSLGAIGAAPVRVGEAPDPVAISLLASGLLRQASQNKRVVPARFSRRLMIVLSGNVSDSSNSSLVR